MTPPPRIPADHVDLEHCAGCGRPFVVPVALLDLVDEGLYLIALQCRNCDRLVVGVHEDAEIEAWDRRQVARAVTIEAEAERLRLNRLSGGLLALDGPGTGRRRR